MTKIKANINGAIVEIEVEESFAQAYTEIEIETQREEWRADRRKKRHEASFNAIEDGGYDIADTAPTPDVLFEEKEKQRMVRKAIKQLPSNYQELIYRVFFEGQSVRSIAQEKGCSSQALDKQLKNAKNKLKEILKNFSI